MEEKQDRSITVTFSVRMTQFSKLLELCSRNKMNRSQLLDAWINRETEALAAAEPEAPPGEVPRAG